jgi:hypothetical protein
VIRYFLVLVLFFYVFVQGAFAQDGEPVISAAQQGNKTIFLLSGNWTAHATSAELVLSSASTIEKAAASKWWKQSENDDESISFTLSEPTNSTSIFMLYSNSTAPTFRYRLSIDSAEYSGAIEPIIDSEGSWYRSWTDNREGAMSAFIPEGWKADLQIVRPYNSMTGFVFFVRGEANALAYVFYPFMPLHILPEDQICEELDTCNGVASTEKVQVTSFGNAPVAVSRQKDPTQYFESEVLPLLRANLEGYSVQSTDPWFALQYDSDNKATTRFLEGLQVSYNFDAQGKKTVGKAAVLISNHTSEESGFWNGVVIGVESSQESFERDFQNATVTLLTLRLDEKWKTREQAVLDQSVENAGPAFRNVTKIIANTTLQDFDSILSTMAHALVRSDASARIGAYNDTATGEEMHLPQYESTQHWYLQDEMLLGRKIGRNIMNSTAIEPLQR